MKKQKGITLIALIVTIIIMLILVGVTIGTVSTGLIGKTKDITIQKSLEMVDTAIKMYKTEKMTTGMMETVDNNTLIQNGILKEYVIEETLRPIAVVEDYLKLRIAEDFGAGYKNIEASGDGYIATLKELENVCAIDLTDGTLYYLDRGKIYSLEGKTEIANNFERENADLEEWTFNESTKTLTAYNGDLTQIRGKQQEGELIIPNYYNGIRVSAVAGNLFNGNTNLTKITISNGIQSLGANLFYNCTNLTGDLIIPDSVTTIGNQAFYGCNNLDGELKLSSNLQTIGGNAFDGCTNLKGSVIIPKGVTSIGASSFRGCSSLDGMISISNTVTSIGNQAFFECSSLIGDLIIPNSVTTIGAHAFYGCSGLNGELKLGTNLQKIGGQAFGGCKLLKGDIVLSVNMIQLDNYSFASCSSINSIKFLNKDTTIYDASTTIDPVIKINGYASSTAEAYATKYNRTFEAIQE